MRELGWEDAAELAERLLRKLPRRDPLTLRPPDLEKWVRELEGFRGPGSPSPAQIERIQAAWFERYSHELADPGSSR